MNVKRRVWYAAVVLLLFLLPGLGAGCEDKADSAPAPSPGPVDIDYTVPESRSFYMGMTPWPYDYSPEAVEQTYDIVNKNTDMIVHHFDEGIPWPEALAGGPEAGTPYHPNVEAELGKRVAHLQPGHKVYVAITPNAQERNKLAGYWGEDTNMERPDEWKDKTFDDPEVVKAYINFARDMIQRFHPDYMAYGIEVTCDFKPGDPALSQFLTFAEQVYSTLKSENPDLPLFMTLCTGSFVNDLDALRQLGRQMLAYSDYVGISTYPYWVVPGMTIREADPKNLPQDWFAQWASLAPDKPFAVTETAYIAEDLVMPKYRVNIKGTEQWQAEYVKLLLESANELDAEFIVWFVSADYDRFWKLMQKIGVDEFYKTWRDTGLLDGELEPRASLELWNAWLDVPRR